MNFRFLIFSVILIFSFRQHAMSQNDYAAVTGGMIFTKPGFSNDFKAVDWKGIYTRTKFLEFGMSLGKVEHQGLRLEGKGFNFFAGANIPLQKLKFGKRHYGVKGFLVQPFIGIDLGRTKVDTYKTWNLCAAPGLSVQLPFLVFDFRLNTMLNFKVEEGSPFKRLSFMPSIACQLDALYDVFDPEVKFDRREHRVNKRTSESTEIKGDWLITTTTTTYEHYDVDVYVNDVKPFRFIGPRFTQRNPSFAGKTFLLGALYGVRKGNLGYDLVVEGGKLGLASSYDKYPTYNSPNDIGKLNKEDSRYVGDISCVRGFTRILFDLNPSNIEATQFARVMAGIGLGYSHVWNHQFYNDSVATEIDSYLANHKEVFVSSAADSRKSKSGVFLNLCLQYERGAISLGYEFNLNVNAELARVNTFTIAYLLPYKRL